MNTIAPCTLPDEAAPLAQQMRALNERIEQAMRMARMAVEQYEASVHSPQETTATPPRRQPDPGLLFLRAARTVLNCIFGQPRLPAARLPVARASRPPSHVSEDAGLFFRAAPLSVAEQPRAEPMRQALRTVSPNHPHGQNRLGAALASGPHRATDLPDLFRRVCNETGIHLNPAQWRKGARKIRAAPA